MYSIVMAVYKKDRPEWFKQALESLQSQTIISDDIVIVADGPLTKQLNDVLDQYKQEKSISLIRLKKNQGLGSALNVGIKHAKNELIARMDSDDIAVQNRFELQLAEFNRNPELEILGGHISEFTDNPEEITAYRKVPITQLEIKKFSRRRSPFNHPTVMYKKSTIQRIGLYDASAIRVEDYDLWLRAISQGVNCANLDVVLLYYRATTEAVERRKTVTSLRSHVKARVGFFTKGYISMIDLCYGIITQTLLFIMPTRLASIVFKKLVRQ